jgi:hypothetical protein
MMQTRSALPLTAEAWAHGELFLWDVIGRALAIGHGLGEEEWFRSGKEGVMQRWM